MANHIYQFLSPLESKLYAYDKLSHLITCDDKKYLRELSTVINFDGVDKFVFTQESDDILSYLSFLKNQIEKLLFNDNLLNRVASHDNIALEFSTIGEVQSALRLEINNYFKQIHSYIEYIQSRNTYEAQSQNNVPKSNSDESKVFEFKESIVTELLLLEFNNQCVFDKEDYNKASENVLKFITGEFHSINPKLNFNVPHKNFAYYLIHSLQYHSNFDLKSIDNVTINNEDFLASNCSKAVTLLKNKKMSNRKQTKEFFIAKDIIDHLIIENRKEIK